MITAGNQLFSESTSLRTLPERPAVIYLKKAANGMRGRPAIIVVQPRGTNLLGTTDLKERELTDMVSLELDWKVVYI